ncbi:MAG: hypothetical protein RDV48_31485 [Candidatus Eremiobacteraeota bacterium]|nr:hypothetical protein [Candidatus Eremiobacteraeota bacterium]
MLLVYLSSSYGYEKCDFGILEGAASRSTLFRHLKRARQCAFETLQSIREVVLEKIVPEAWELITLDGLSPPRCWKLKALEVSPLAEAFSIIFTGITQLCTPLSLLLARAQERSATYRRPFLLNVR